MSLKQNDEYWENRYEEILNEIGCNYNDPDDAERATARRIESEQIYGR